MSPAAKTRRLVRLRRPAVGGDARVRGSDPCRPPSPSTSRLGAAPRRDQRWLPATRRPSASTSVGPGSTRGNFAARSASTPRAPRPAACRRPVRGLPWPAMSRLDHRHAAAQCRHGPPPFPARSGRRRGSAGGPGRSRSNSVALVDAHVRRGRGWAARRPGCRRR